jgi:O-Antigen ligase
MSVETLIIARVAFWLLAALVVFLPARWSTVAFLLLVQFDLSGTASYTAESLGIENAIKVTLIPTILLWRIKEEISFDPHFARLRHIWLLFAGYACLAILWSPFKLSALKMLGYFYAYCVLFLVFTVAWRKRWFNARSLMIVLWCSLLFAFVQTYGLANEYGSVGNFYGSIDYEFRFTSFTGAQSFAAFLLSIFVLLIFCEEWNLATFAAAAGATTGLILTGSRSIFLGFAWILVLSGVISAKRRGKVLSLGAVAKRMTIGAAVLLCVAALVLSVLPENRLNQMLSASVSSDRSLEDIGTFVWRFALYQKTLEELAHRRAATLLAGSGTSSAATLVLDTGFFQQSNVDPNRALHDEFLRSLYEWGAPGLFLLLLFLGQAARICFRIIRETDSKEAWAFLAILVPLLISLTVENFLAESASPGGVGYTLVLTCMLARASVKSEATERTTLALFPSDAIATGAWRPVNFT